MASGDRLPFATTRSPEDSPRSRRPIHGTRYSRAQWMLSRRISSAPRGGSGGHGWSGRRAPPGRGPGRRAGRRGCVPPPKMEPVVVPRPPVLHGPQGPQVQHRAVVAVGDGPDMGGVHGDLAPQMLEHGDATGVEAGGDHDRADRLRQVGDRTLEALCHIVRVGAGTDDVVAARAEADQIRCQLLGAGDLVLDYLVEEFSAYGEVGVAEVAVGPAVREEHREPVGPADKRPVRAGVADALGEAVPHRHVRPDHCLLSFFESSATRAIFHLRV